MVFINNMRGILTHASQTTVQKAKDLSELARLNGEISNSEKQINDLYGKIGYEIYCAYCNAPLPEVEELIKQVNDLHQTITACKLQIKAINTADTCPRCGGKITKEMAYCSECGQKLIAEEESISEQELFCTNCGSPISPGSVFCTSCGHKNG